MLNDLRFACRSIRRTPIFAFVVVVTLAVSIGGVTAVASVARATVFPPLPYPAAEQLFVVGRYPAATNSLLDMSTFFLLRDRFSSCSRIAARTGRPGANLVAGDHAEYVRNALVTAGYFEALGLPPQFGREFRVQDEENGGPRIAILDHALAQRIFGNPRDAVGKTVDLGSQPYEVVGVVPNGSTGAAGAGIWLPLKTQHGAQTGLNFTVTCRLRSNIELQQARADLLSLQPEYKALHLSGSTRELANDQLDLAPYRQYETRSFRGLVTLLGVAVGVVLLIACANCAWLFSVRAVDRRGEAAIRAALGAGRWQIARHVLSESLVLTLTGGALGIGVAILGLPWLLSLPASEQGWAATTDIVVLGSAFLVSVTAGCLCAVVPAVRHARLDPIEALQAGSHRMASSRDSATMRRGMVFGEVAICMVLLVTSGLLIRSLEKLQRVDVGFDSRKVVTAQMTLDDDAYRSALRVTALYDRVLGEISAMPAVESAAVITNIPIDRGLNLAIRLPVSIPGSSVASVDWRYVTERYFETMRIPVKQGRQFTAADQGFSTPVAIVNQAFVDRFFPDKNALGVPVELNRVAGVADSREIVGVSGNTLQEGLAGTPPPTIYVPVRQAPDALLATAHAFFPVTWVIRYRSSPAGITEALGAAIKSADPALPLSRVRTMDEVIAVALGETRLQAVLLTLFGTISVLMAITALAGSALYSVMRRRRDIGLRLALGATVPMMLRAIVGENVALAAAGIAAGIVGGLLLGGLLRPFLFGVTSTDLTTYLAAAVLLFCVAAITSLIAAAPILRIHPTDSLRAE